MKARKQESSWTPYGSPVWMQGWSTFCFPMGSEGAPILEAMVATKMTFAAELRRTRAGKPNPCVLSL